MTSLAAVVDILHYYKRGNSNNSNGNASRIFYNCKLSHLTVVLAVTVVAVVMHLTTHVNSDSSNSNYISNYNSNNNGNSGRAWSFINTGKRFFLFFIIFYLLARHNICLPRLTCPTPPAPSLHACHLTTSAVIDMLLPLLFLLLLLLSHSRAVLFSSLPAFFSVSFFRCYFVILYFDLIVVFFATFLSAPKNVFINNFVALLICCC